MVSEWIFHYVLSNNLGLGSKYSTYLLLNKPRWSHMLSWTLILCRVRWSKNKWSERESVFQCLFPDHKATNRHQNYSCDFFYFSWQPCEIDITFIIILDYTNPLTTFLCREWATSFLCSTAYPAPSLLSNTTGICEYKSIAKSGFNVGHVESEFYFAYCFLFMSVKYQNNLNVQWCRNG